MMNPSPPAFSGFHNESIRPVLYIINCGLLPDQGRIFHIKVSIFQRELLRQKASEHLAHSRDIFTTYAMHFFDLQPTLSYLDGALI